MSVLSAVLRARQIDVAPSIAGLMGRMEEDVPVQGLSLWRKGASDAPAFATTFFDELGSALVEGPDKYIYEPASNALRHYHLPHDPHERDGRQLEPDEAEPMVRRLQAFAAHQKRQFKID